MFTRGYRQSKPPTGDPWLLWIPQKSMVTDLAEDVVWNYGQYGLLGILMREEIMPLVAQQAETA